MHILFYVIIQAGHIMHFLCRVFLGRILFFILRFANVEEFWFF